MISKVELAKELVSLTETLVKEYGRRPALPAMRAAPSDPFSQTAARMQELLEEAATERNYLRNRIARAVAQEREHLATAQSRINRAESREAAELDVMTVAELSEAHHLRRDITIWEADLAEAEEELILVQRFQAGLEAARRRMRTELESLQRKDRTTGRRRWLAGTMKESAEISRVFREELIPHIDYESARAEAGQFVVQNDPVVSRIFGAADVVSDQVRDEIRRMFDRR